MSGDPLDYIWATEGLKDVVMMVQSHDKRVLKVLNGIPKSRFRF